MWPERKIDIRAHVASRRLHGWKLFKSSLAQIAHSARFIRRKIMEKSEISAKIKDILTQNLGIDADMLTDEAELFGGDIGLDSIDSLEIIAGIDREFGVSMTGVGKEHFFNVASLTKYVEEHLN